MRKIFLVILLIIFFQSTANAVPRYVPTETIAGIHLSVSSQPPTSLGFASGCNEIWLSATGAISTFGTFTATGALNCSGGSYPMQGSGYLTPGKVVMQLAIYDFYFNCSLGQNDLGGTCSYSRFGQSYGNTTLAPIP